MSILIVDDSPDNVQPLKILLETTGYSDLVTAASASEAFDRLGLHDPTSTGRGIEVILMDIRMPGMDGIDACRTIKAEERFGDIPLIMLTAQASEKDLEAAFAAGANDFLAKPFSVVELLARLRSALLLKREMDRRKSREQQLLRVTQHLDEANQELQRLSSLDGLTGIANRRQLDNLYQREWRHALRQGSPLAVIMIDIDFFKAYNDTYGHLQGDACLKKVADALGRALRRSSDLVARYGGEEFLAVLQDTDARGASLVAEAMRARVERLGIVHASSLIADHVTISLGVAGTVPRSDSSPEALMAAADQALYQIKQDGRNGFKVIELEPAAAVEVGPRTSSAVMNRR